MIIRRPNTLDVVKVASFLFPDQSEDQAECVSIWLQQQQTDSFIDLVAVHKKKVVGFFAGHLNDTHLEIVQMRAETADVLTTLWKKVQSTHEFDSAGVSTGDPVLFRSLGFEPVFTVMQYQKEQDANEAVPTVS